MTNVANIFGTNTDNESDGFGGVTELDGATEAVGVTLGGTTYVYAAGYNDFGIQTFTLLNGALTPVGSLVDDTTNDISYTTQLEVVSGGGFTYLVIKGYYSLSIARIDPGTGALTITDTITDDATTSLVGDWGLETVRIGTRTFFVTANDASSALNVFSFNATTGDITLVETVLDTDNLTFELAGVKDIASAAVGGTTYVFAAGNSDSGISVFRMSGTGQLTNTFNLEDSGTLELSGAFAIETVTIGASTFLYVGGYSDYGISVFRVETGGTLTSIADYDFGSNPFAGLYGPIDFSVLSLDGANFLVANGDFGDHLVAYSIEADGTLVEIGRVIDGGSLELDAPRLTSFLTINGTTHLLATGFADDGISVFEVGGGDDVLGGGAGDDRVFGFAGDDVLGGKDGNDSLFGGDGIDVLAGGGGRDALRGGIGGDILIGGGNVDQIDYTGSTLGVTVNLAAGTAAGGHATGDVFYGVEGVIGSNLGDRITGDGGANTIEGQGGTDRLFGLEGDDAIFGGDGTDTIDGGQGNDTIVGGAGIASILGGTGNDSITSADGADQIAGGDGNDRVAAGGANDSVAGGAGADSVNGGGGNDTIGGNTGDDTMAGSSGGDTFVFVNGDGADTITDFANGQDRMDVSNHVSVTGFASINSIQIGANLLVQFDADDTVILRNFLKADLDATDFVF